MNTPTLLDPQAEAYQTALRNHLAPIALAEREDILREIAAHIRDSVESGSTTEAVLTRLGPPEELAAQYRDGALIRAASHSISPLTLLRATLRVATKGIAGVVVFFCGLFGYLTGGGLFIAGILKPFAPNHVGIFTTNSTTVMQQTGQTVTSIQTTGPRHEILGWWAIPICLILGPIILVLTTLAIRGFLRLSHQLQRILLGAPPSDATLS
jgi:uncharacterized membrane protein